MDSRATDRVATGAGVIDPNLTLIVAVSRNGFIGKDGTIPWRIPEDLKFFKKTTTGSVVIMGRKTFQSIGHPLPNRTNIVLTSTKNYARRFEANAEIPYYAESIEDALWYAETVAPTATKYVIGGARVYADALPIAKRIYWTEIDQDVDGDVRMPSIEGMGFVEIWRKAGETPGVTFTTLERP